MWEKIGHFLYHVSPAVLALLGGSLVLQRYFITKANEANFIDAIIRDLESLKNDSISYWSRDASAENKSELEGLAQKIIGSVKALDADVKAYCRRYCAKRESELVQFMVELADACTGGHFQTAKRKADSGRVLPITNCISRIKLELRKRKL
jgi:hypothetical protein